MAKGQKGCVNQSCETWAGGEKKKFYNDIYDFCPKCGQPLKYVCKRCGMELPDGSKKYCERCENEIKDERDRKLETFAKGIQKGANKVAKFAEEKYKDIADDLGEGKDKLEKVVEDVSKGASDKFGEIANKFNKKS